MISLFFLLAAAVSLPANLLPQEAGSIPGGVANTFEGAKWIGCGADALPLYPDYLTVFRIEFDIETGENGSAAVIYGMDDPRLMKPNLNIYNLSAGNGESYVKIEFRNDGEIKVFRTGYHPDDNADIPLTVFRSDLLRKGKNHITISSNFGHTDISVDGGKAGYVGINPLGNGGDYIAFPALADVATEIKGEGTLSNLTVRNFREPGNILFQDAARHTESGRIDIPVRSMPLLRSRIPVAEGKEVETASIDITARGIYDLTINGERVTDDYFLPGSTQYDKTHLYHTFDITRFLHGGSNPVYVQLGEGWWCGPATYMGEMWNFFGDRESLLARVTVDYTDGSRDIFLSDPEFWEYTAEGPLITGSFFNGETLDASRSVAASSWRQAVEISCDTTAYPFATGWDGLNLRPSFGDRVTATDTLTALSVSTPREGVHVYDFGQNFAGVPLLVFPSTTPGDVVTLRYAEVLYPDREEYGDNRGMIMTENIRAAMNKDTYICAGGKGETFSPRFTLHGFRFLELTGPSQPLPPENVKALSLSSIDRFKAHFECSDTLVNRLWENILWSTRSNFISIPTDCPQRNERLGWMGDISVFAPTATKIADVSPLLRQYLQSVRDCQSPDGRFPDVAPTGVGFGGFLWGSAGITVPFECLRQYGDTATVREHYPAMRRYIRYVMENAIDSVSGVIVQDRAWGDLGDWLSPEYEKNDKSLLWECYLIHDLDLMSQMALTLGETEDAAHYRSLADGRREFFKRVYIDPVTQKTRFSSFDPAREGSLVDTQASYALPIAMGIVDNPQFTANFLATLTRENTADNGRSCPPHSLMTGFIGTAWISEALSRCGYPEEAYRLLTATAYPSWLYPVTQGATTVWERLDSYTHTDGFGSNNSMNSFNHYSFGSVGDWLLTRCLGITYSPTGITISPQPDTSGSLTFAKGELETPSGLVRSGWRIDGDFVEYDLEVPEETVFTPFGREPVNLSAGHHTLRFPLGF